MRAVVWSHCWLRATFEKRTSSILPLSQLPFESSPKRAGGNDRRQRRICEGVRPLEHIVEVDPARGGAPRDGGDGAVVPAAGDECRRPDHVAAGEVAEGQRVGRDRAVVGHPHADPVVEAAVASLGRDADVVGGIDNVHREPALDRVGLVRGQRPVSHGQKGVGGETEGGGRHGRRRRQVPGAAEDRAPHVPPREREGAIALGVDARADAVLRGVDGAVVTGLMAPSVKW